MKFGIGNFIWKSVSRFQIRSKLRKNIGHLTWRLQYFLLWTTMLHHHKSTLFEWYGIRLFL